MYGNIVPTPLQPWSCDKFNMQRQLVGVYELVKVYDQGYGECVRSTFKLRGSVFRVGF